MTILDRILQELGRSKGPISSLELAGRVGVTVEALDGMITVLVAKGKLAGSDGGTGPIEEVVACAGTVCGTSCVGLDKCAFIVDIPESFSLVVEPVSLVIEPVSLVIEPALTGR